MKLWIYMSLYISQPNGTDNTHHEEAKSYKSKLNKEYLNYNENFILNMAVGLHQCEEACTAK